MMWRRFWCGSLESTPENEYGASAFLKIAQGDGISADQVGGDFGGVVHTFQPDAFRRCSESVGEVDKVGIGSAYDEPALSCVLVDSSVRGLPAQPDMADVSGARKEIGVPDRDSCSSDDGLAGADLRVGCDPGCSEIGRHQPLVYTDLQLVPICAGCRYTMADGGAGSSGLPALLRGTWMRTSARRERTTSPKM